MIRLCNPGDVEYLINLGIDCYPSFDVEATRSWFQKNMINSNIFVAMGDDCGGLCAINTPFWQPTKPNFELEFLCCRKTRFGAVECLKLMAFFNDLRRSQGYDRLWINSRLADLEPFVKRLGGKTAGKSWILED